DYDIKHTWEAGVVLEGHEVKSLRLKQGSLEGSYIKIINQEAWLLNARVNPYRYAYLENYDPKKTRKLLLTKKEIYQLIDAINQKNLTIIPLEIFLRNNKIKIKIGAGKGKREYEKRAVIKKRDLKRQMSKEFKRSNLKI
ncbi:MAG: SsrA-binding protein, partial [Microgenomates bacterium 39_7]